MARQPDAPVGALQIAPSILSADFSDLAGAIHSVDAATDRLHIDVMDGHFVPNLTLGPSVVASIRRCSAKFFDCHLMLTDPAAYLGAFADAGADGCTVHVEVGGTGLLIDQARALGLNVGLACNPDTPYEAVAPWLDKVDLVLCMTVFPGFAGQSFIESVLGKIAQVRTEIDRRGLAVDLEVDGGIDHETAPRAVAAGANVLVAGSAIFSAPSPLDAARGLYDVAAAVAGAR
ncbi:MAG TPA: ribulose-phosphate 3-epimerase [Acidimicrobiales bacterium]|nr:ribulose-phosphate 3-epimerase [Acidimicrobiales bacterium]